MRSHKHTRRQLFFFLIFLCVACFYAVQDRWGVPFYWFKWPVDKPVTVIPQEAKKPPRDEPVTAIGVEPKKNILEAFYFKNAESLSAWEQKVFKGKTDYTVMTEGAVTFLRSQSSNASSGLFIKTKHAAPPGLKLSWKWRAHKFPQKRSPEKLSNRAEDDFAARIYVIFAASNIFRSDVIEYIWDESLPVGSLSESPYSDRIQLLVIKSGLPDDPQAWSSEERDVYADYKALFGREPKHDVGMIAVMSDSDNTGTEAVADFADLALARD